MSNSNLTLSSLFAFKTWAPSPTFPGLTTSNVVVVQARYFKIFKFVVFYLHITFDVASGTGEVVEFDFPVTAANTDGSGFSSYFETGLGNVLAGSIIASTTALGHLVRAGNWSTNTGNIVKGFGVLEAA